MTERTTLTGKSALVTGASRGIGRAIAVRLAREGATVAVHYGRSADAARTVLDEIEAAGGRGFLVGADLADAEALPGLVEAVGEGLAGLGHATLDLLIHNAGIGGGGAIGEADEAGYDAIFGVNVRTPFFLTKRLLPTMGAGGRIVAISSMVAFGGNPSRILYAMSKAALNHFVRGLAAELGPRGITVNAVAPGATLTEFLGPGAAEPESVAFLSSIAVLGRVGQPQDMAGVVAFLCGPDGGWITGQVIQASGGMAL